MKNGLVSFTFSFMEIKKPIPPLFNSWEYLFAQLTIFCAMWNPPFRKALDLLDRKMRGHWKAFYR